MLTADQITALGDKAQRITDPIVEFLIEDIARRVSEAGQLTSTASYQVWRLQQLGMSQQEVQKEIRKRLGVSQRQVEQLLTQAAEVGYDFDLSRLPHADAVPFADNETVQQIVSSGVQMAQDDLSNMVGTLGFVNHDGVSRPLTEAYQQACDFAFQKVAMGAQDYNSAIRQATKGLAERGIVSIDYESGISTSIEAAVRRNVMGALGTMQEQISQQTHDDLGCDGWEIDAHMASAPDHEPIQGKQYSDEAYEKLSACLVRQIRALGCGHDKHPIILGVNEPQYSAAELEQFRQANEKGVDYEGRHYTMYEATQRQRKLERSIRNRKRRILIDQTTGDKERLAIDQTRLVILNDEYARFSKAAGLRSQRERMNVAGFGAKEAREAEKGAKERVGKIAETGDTPKKDTSKVRNAQATATHKKDWDNNLGARSWNKTKRKAMYSAECGTVDKKYETARLYDGDGKRIFQKNGDSGSVSFTAAEIKQMHGGVLTHNHPNGSCFSPEDINMLRLGKLTEVRAVTARGVYRLQKPEKWSRAISSLEKIDAVYYDIDNHVSPSIYAKAARGEISFAQADLLCQEAVIREFGNRYGLSFGFDTWDEIKEEIK